MALFDFIRPLIIKAPEITYFDHLVSEFESMETAFASEEAAAASVLRAPSESPADDGGLGEGDAEQTEAERRAAAAKRAEAEKRAAAAALAAQKAAEMARRVFEQAKVKVKELMAKRYEQTIDWSDIYLLEMLLADVRPVGSLRAKVLSLRRDYRSVAGQVEYDEYVASKPKNLQDPPDPLNPPDASANYETLLREDLKDLLGRLFKRYAFLPVRESRLRRLTVWASLFSALFLVILIAFILSMNYRGEIETGGEGQRLATQLAITALATGGQPGPLLGALSQPVKPTPAPDADAARQDSDAKAGDNAQAGGDSRKRGAAGVRGGRKSLFPSIALFVVLVSGAMGGFVSALQRIQSSPTEGDSVYNLSMLYHGSYAVFVAPLTGAIFAILLYLMFTGKILEGRFFPNVYTPPMTAAKPTPTPSPENAAVNPDTNARNTDTGNANTNVANANAGNTNARNRNGRSTNAANANTANANAVNSNAGNVNAGNTNAATAGGGNVNAGNASAGNSNAGSAGGGETANDNANDTDETAGRTTPDGTPTPTPTPPQVPVASLSVRDFLYDSGPASGQDYALLIIWSFIAGFAERFVPDSLNRLIASRQSANQPGA
jgi:hypothetical protein